MTWVQLLDTFWPIFSAIGAVTLAALIWCLRLEGRQALHKELSDEKHAHLLHRLSETEKSATDLYTKHNDLKEDLNKSMSEISKTLARIEGRLSVKQDD
jgi:uncharacterized protein YlxW (UPF0749 family)